MARDSLAVDLTGRVALVTGASSGLGRHFAGVLGGAGASVIAAGRRAEALAETVSTIAMGAGRAFPVVMDVTNPRSVESAFAEAISRVGRPPDLLINNAGIALTRAAIDITPDEWSEVIETNLSGAFTVATQAARRMREAGGGSIVNISSIAGIRPAGMVAPYAASKAALIQLTRTLALEWARYGIRVNALAPGYIETDLNRTFFESDPGQRLIKRIPQRRLGRMDELDGPLLLLCSEASSYMTGAIIAVDGGHLVSSL